jgi:hypothetical protein
MSRARIAPDEYSDVDELFERMDAVERRNVTMGLGSPVNVPIVGVGNAGSKRAGRKLVVADFTVLLGVAAPIALYNFDNNPNDLSGNARHLTPTTAAPTYQRGIEGVATSAIRFAGNNAMGLFLADASGGPFDFRTGTFGCWFKTAKTGTSQRLISKGANVAAQRAWQLSTDGATGALKAMVSTDGSNSVIPVGVTNVHDDRWHFGVGTYDGTLLRVYCDASLEATGRMGGDIAQNAQPFNIGSGGITAAAGTGSENLPMWGLIDEAFVHPEVLDENQIRLLMAASIAHSTGLESDSIAVRVRRRRRGGRLVATDFPATPRRLYNLGSDVVGDEGADASGAGTVAGTVPYVDGIDGTSQGAKSFPGVAGNYATFTPPALITAQAKTIGCWFQTLGVGGAQMTVVSLGGGTATDWRALYIQSNGVPSMWDGSGVTPPFIGQNVVDGLPHFWVVVLDNNAADGLKRKTYLDTQLFSSDTSFVNPTIGTGSIYLGQLSNGTELYKGLIDGLFMCDYAMTAEQIAALFAVGSKTLPAAVLDQSIIEAVDASNVYMLADKLDPQHLLDLKMAA